MVTMTAPHDRDPQNDRDDDAVFRQIVAGFDTTSEDAVPRWPVSEDLADDRADDQGEADEQAELSPYRDGSSPQEALPGWVEPAALPDEGHYEPPPPPRLPRLRVRTLGALLLAVAGFAVLFTPYAIGFDDSPGSMVLGMLLVAGGATILVKGMRDAPGADDRPDDGAVV
jgi:hypothetical protein